MTRRSKNAPATGSLEPATTSTAQRPLAFCDAKAGCGKTTPARKIAYDLCSEDILIMLTASTALAATLYDGGWTTHSAAKMPVRADAYGNFEIACPPEGTMTKQREGFLMAVKRLRGGRGDESRAPFLP